MADVAQLVIMIYGRKMVVELMIGDRLLTLNGLAEIINNKRFDVEVQAYDLVFEKLLNYYANRILVNDVKSYMWSNNPDMAILRAHIRRMNTHIDRVSGQI